VLDGVRPNMPLPMGPHQAAVGRNRKDLRRRLHAQGRSSGVRVTRVPCGRRPRSVLIVMPVVSSLIRPADLEKVDVGWGPRVPMLGFWGFLSDGPVSRMVWAEACM
jgi:hypothetical protein